MDVMLSLLTMRAEAYSAQLASNETAAKGGVFVAADRCDFRLGSIPAEPRRERDVRNCINIGSVGDRR